MTVRVAGNLESVLVHQEGVAITLRDRVPPNPIPLNGRFALEFSNPNYTPLCSMLFATVARDRDLRIEIRTHVHIDPGRVATIKNLVWYGTAFTQENVVDTEEKNVMFSGRRIVFLQTDDKGVVFGLMEPGGPQNNFRLKLNHINYASMFAMLTTSMIHRFRITTTTDGVEDQDPILTEVKLDFSEQL